MDTHRYPQFSLRIKPELIEKLKFIAHENSRSINKEIEQIILKYIREYEQDFGPISKADIYKTTST